MDYTVHGILQARILEWVAFPFSSASSQPRDQTQVSCIAGRFFTSWATREAQEHWSRSPISSRSSRPRNRTGGNFYIQNWINNKVLLYSIGFPGGAVVKNLPANIQESQVWSLIQEDPTSCGTTKQVHRNYWACALEPGSNNYWSLHAQNLCAATREATAVRRLHTTARE